MIDNPNKHNFYTSEEMDKRKEYIPKMKQDLLDKLKDLTEKINSEEPFPHGNQDIDFLCEAGDRIEEILNNWYY